MSDVVIVPDSPSAILIRDGDASVVYMTNQGAPSAAAAQLAQSLAEDARDAAEGFAEDAEDSKNLAAAQVLLTAGQVDIAADWAAAAQDSASQAADSAVSASADEATASDAAADAETTRLAIIAAIAGLPGGAIPPAYPSRTLMAAQASPAVGDSALLTETGRAGVFKVVAYADVSEAADLDTEQGIYVISSVDATKVFVRQASVLTPYMFGASGADVLDLDSSDDDSVALQAFFDAGWLTSAAHRYVFDFSGHWAVSQPLFFARPNTLADTHELHGRRFVMGHIHVLPVAQQPGGVPMDTVFTISGSYSTWSGHLFIHSDGRGAVDYVDRRFHFGVHLLQVGESTVGQITVFDAKKGAVFVDGRADTWLVRAGTDFETGSSSSNQIGLQIKAVVGVNCGSTISSGLTHGRCLSLTVTAKEQGGDPASGGTFDATPASYTSSHEQRTRLTVASTAEIEAGEWGAMRIELAPVNYTSLAANSGTKKFTFTVGSPASLGLGVGQKFTLEDGSNVGANDGTTFEIVAVGASDITVYPAPTTEGATIYTALYTELSAHQIRTVSSGTQFAVTPWVPDAANSKWYHISGPSVHLAGADTANVHFGYVCAFNSGMGILNDAQYSAVVDTFLIDVGSIGVAHGTNQEQLVAGLAIQHSHSEGINWDIIQVAQTYGGMKFAASSSFWNNAIGLRPRAATTSPRQSSYTLAHVEFSYGGVAYGATHNVTTFNDVSLSNAPDISMRVLLDDQSYGPVHTCTLSFDEQAYHLGKSIGTLIWTNSDGTAPDGTMNFALDAAMTGKGWSIQGATGISAPSTSIRFEVIYDLARRVAVVARV